MKDKINIAELLKDCPKGMELDCIMFVNPVTLDEVVDGDTVNYPITIITHTGNLMTLTKYGTYAYEEEDAKCVIYPKGKTTWEGFVPPCKFKDGDIAASNDGLFIGIVKYADENSIYTYYAINKVGNLTKNFPYFLHRFAPEEEKQKLFDTIKDNGYRWNPETKTLERLIQPKFRVGDRIKHIVGREEIATVISVEKSHYNLDSKVGTSSFSISLQREWELVPNKFDINTLVPFESRVLVRDNRLQKWFPAIWGFYDSDSQDYQYKLVGVIARYCIPYEGNEHLLGTSNDCDKFYKTWE